MALQFKKAVKHDARGRVAFVGPAGSGKSYTMLTLARLLAGPDGKIAAVDTEHGSLSKYADLFEFDVIEPDSYSPETFFAALDAAESNGYAVFCCDSLSHFWMGKDGALEYVDTRAKRGGGKDDSFAGWKAFRPHERSMVDRIISSPCHVIVTMRTKNEYVTEEYTSNGQKKTKRTKIGLAPVQREGIEYEFDLCMTFDDNNEAMTDKTRCPAYAGKIIEKPSAKAFEPFRDWLKGALRIDPPKPAPIPETTTAAQHPQGQVPKASVDQACDEFKSADRFGRLASFGALKKASIEFTGSDFTYREILGKHIPREDWREDGPHADGFKKLPAAVAAFRELWEHVAKVSAPPQASNDGRSDCLPEVFGEESSHAQ